MDELKIRFFSVEKLYCAVVYFDEIMESCSVHLNFSIAKRNVLFRVVMNSQEHKSAYHKKRSHVESEVIKCKNVLSLTTGILGAPELLYL